MNGFRIEVDVSGADRRMRRLGDGPGIDDLVKFEQVLVAQYVASQQHVHRITHSLARSGRTDSDYENNAWSGELAYGGESAGSVHNPVQYAQAERARLGAKGGTSHDFMEPVEPIGDSGYVDAIEAFFRGTT